MKKLIQECNRLEVDKMKIKELLDLNADPNKLTEFNYECDTSFNQLCYNWPGDMELITHFLSIKADPFIINEGGYNALHYACYSNNFQEELVKLLIDMVAYFFFF